MRIRTALPSRAQPQPQPERAPKPTRFPTQIRHRSAALDAATTRTKDPPMAIVRRAKLDRTRILYLAAGILICLIGVYLIVKP